MAGTTRRDMLRRAGFAAVFAAGSMAGCGEPQERSVTASSQPADGSTALGGATALPVGIARCDSYDLPTLVERLGGLADKIGGLRSLVEGKTVAVKVNLTGSPTQGALGLSAGRTYQVHPNAVRALAILLDRAGARRIRFLESTFVAQPIEKTLLACGWDLAALKALKTTVEFEDTRNRGSGSSYKQLPVPGGGGIFPAYLLNRSYVDCDVYISLAKLKNHRVAGVTLSMKNSFGITPTSLYGQAKEDEHSTEARGSMLHAGSIAPAAGIPQELHPDSPRVPSYRVPRIIIDIAAIRPVDLAILDGIETVSGGEMPGALLTAQKPHLLIVGKNPVCTDTVAMTCMGYDPQAARATGPFPGDNHLAIAAEHGLGTNDPKRVEVVGLSVAEARHDFAWEPAKRDG